jgi:hypothetical protein
MATGVQYQCLGTKGLHVKLWKGEGASKKFIGHAAFRAGAWVPYDDEHATAAERCKALESAVDSANGKPVMESFGIVKITPATEVVEDDEEGGTVPKRRPHK